MCVHVNTQTRTHCPPAALPNIHFLPQGPRHAQSFPEVIVVLVVLCHDEKTSQAHCPSASVRVGAQVSWRRTRGGTRSAWEGLFLCLASSGGTTEAGPWTLGALSQASVRLGRGCLQPGWPDAAAPVGLSCWEIFSYL